MLTLHTQHANEDAPALHGHIDACIAKKIPKSQKIKLEEILEVNLD